MPQLPWILAHGALAAWLWLAACGAAWGADALDVSQVGVRAQLDAYLQVLPDGDAAMSPGAALERGGWLPATPERLRRASASSGFWLRLPLANQGAERVTRWLVVGSPRLEAVDFFLVPEGRLVPQATQRGGMLRPLDERPVAGTESIFTASLAPGERAVALVRVQTRTPVDVNVEVWEPLAYRDHQLRDHLWVLVPVTALAVVALALLAHALVRRDIALLSLAGWLVSAGVHELAQEGYLYRHVFDQGGELALRVPFVAALAVVMSSAAFFHTFLGIKDLPGWRHVFPTASVISVLLLVGLTWVDLHAFAEINLMAIALYIGLGAAALISAWHHGRPYAGLVLMLSAGQAIAYAWRLLPPPLGTRLGEAVHGGASGAVIYTAVLGAVLMFVVIRRSQAQLRRAIAERDRRDQAGEAEKRRLELAVHERTQALQDALIASNEASRAKMEFLGQVSHDLRSPLTAIIGYADMIIAAGRRDAENARIIRRSARHLLGLLNDLIDYVRASQPGMLQLAPVYTSAMLNGIAAEGRALAEKNGNVFEFKAAATLPLVIAADAKRLRQVMENLLSNAAKFTRGGYVQFHVGLEAGPRAGGPADPTCHFVFTVRDTGPGIPAQALRNIFEPFQRLKSTEHHEGLGLGLSIAHQWVARMGGRIEAASQVGHGTTMRVHLPLALSSEESLAEDQRMEDDGVLPQLDGGGRVVWIVEDSKVIRQMLNEELERVGFHVVAFGGGRAALEQIRAEDQQPPDLILTDLQMPHADGRDVLAHARRRWPGLPVVLLTAALEPPAAEEDGFTVVMTKPLSMSKLRQTVGQLLGLCAQASGMATLPMPVPPREAPPAWRPDEAMLQRGRELLRMCAVSDLVDWAEDLARQDPAAHAFAAKARALAERTDLKALAQLLD